MNNKELKQAIAADIETLKGLDVEIIPARTYYLGLLKLVAGGIWKLGLVVFLAITFSFIHNPTHPMTGRGDYVELIFWSALASFFMALCAMFFLLSTMSQYYLIQYHLKNRLKTGSLLVNKLRHCGWFFWGVFTLFCLMFASYTESAAIFLMIGFSFMASAFITHLAISMEMNRVGISTLFTVVNEFFNKDKTA